MKNFILLFTMILMGFYASAQHSITGVVLDQESSAPLAGAKVTLENSNQSTVTNAQGVFSFTGLPSGEDVLVIRFFGYDGARKTVNINGATQIGPIKLGIASKSLDEARVVGVVDLVKDRQTPVAASTIKASEIELKLGNQEFPEIMKTTPSVYATKQGGGYGDSRINVRGFDQRNVSIIINGQPVNDMENGWVYWSNWAGLQDIASGIEIQRGVGASRLAVPSVGGTINIVTKTTDSRQGGFVKFGVGNAGYLKGAAGVNTGKGKSGWSLSMLLGGWKGNGYVDGTKGQGMNYLVGVGYEPNEKNSFNFSIIGASQWHHQRDQELSIRDYEKYGDIGLDRTFNGDHGTLNGEEYSFRRNFYNKPIATINWDFDISDRTTLNTALYGSWGRGGGTGPRGKNYGIYPYNKDLTQAIGDGDLSYRTDAGYIDYDAVKANNMSGSAFTGGGYLNGLLVGSNGFDSLGVNKNIAIRRASVNSHNWYGLISNIEHKVDNWTFGAGIDIRNYTGFHYRAMNDYLGLDAYASTGNKYAPVRYITSSVEAKPWSNISNAEKIDYYNVGKVGWLGFNTITEYVNEDFSAVVQAGISNQNYQRIDYFDQYPQNSNKHNMTGGFVKGGANYNINEKHNVFFNAGYISRQPIFDAIFPNYSNKINEEVENEHITSFELGYGFRSGKFDAKANLYNTSWSNRWLSRGVTLAGGVSGTAVFSNITNLHQGIEVEMNYRALQNLRFRAMGSFGNWTYTDDFSASVFDDNQVNVGTGTLYLADEKVGDAAQTTANVGMDWNFWGPLSMDINWALYTNLYADYNVLDSRFFDEINDGVIKLPSYNLVDLGFTAKLSVGSGSDNLILRANINNLLDTEYIAESNTNYQARQGDTTYRGISKLNRVWFGFGRTWNLSVRYNF